MLLPLFYRRPRCLVNDPAPDVFGQSRGREEGWGWGAGMAWGLSVVGTALTRSLQETVDQ